MGAALAAAFLIGGACSTKSGDCASLGDAVARDECWFQRVLASPESLDDALAAIPDADSRDMLVLRLAIRDPARGPELCGRVETEAARARCQQVVGRPHLRSAR